MTEEGAPHRTTIRVYYEDTDFSGVVYHANYLRFLERGRTEALRALGISQTELHAGRHGPPIAFAVTRMEIGFRGPARMDDLVTVETEPLSVGGASLTLRQRLRRQDELLVEASVTVAALSGGRVARLPEPIVAKLKRWAASAEPATYAAARRDLSRR